MRQSFYKFVIQPIIDYACVIWGATSQYNLGRDPKNLETASQESCYMASLANQQLSYTKKNWHVLAQRKIVLAKRKIKCALSRSQQVINAVDQSESFAVYRWVLALLADLLWLLLFEEAFIKVMELSVSILEADSVHLCHLQLRFSIDRIRSIYGHKQNN